MAVGLRLWNGVRDGTPTASTTSRRRTSCMESMSKVCTEVAASLSSSCLLTELFRAQINNK